MHTPFQQTVLDYFYEHQRTLAWRTPDDSGNFDSYKIMVSEIMLQQTQVPRVTEKYRQFLEVFPTIQSLANASLQDVLFVWQGLGYNRRGRFLREAARMVVDEYEGHMPRTVDELVRLPGIGHNTACAILVYSYNMPLVFVETNVRSVYLHHFYADQAGITDTQIAQKVSETIDVENPREWYWALMDYGTFIKKQFGNPNVRSKHYAKQSAFKGSKREVRGAVLRALTSHEQSLDELRTTIADERLEAVLKDLCDELLITVSGEYYTIAS